MNNSFSHVYNKHRNSSDIDRKIAVIFATDLVGYSKHMKKNENATLRALRECNKIIKPIIKNQKGRIFYTGGAPYLQSFQVLLLQSKQLLSFRKTLKILMIMSKQNRLGFNVKLTDLFSCYFSSMNKLL